MIPIKVLVPSGVLGLGFDLEALNNGVKNNPDIISIDGGSTDNTIDIIKKNSKHITFWQSKKDKGIYDAWNKGIKLASGDYICFLNVGDFFAQNCIEIVVKKIKRKYVCL